MPKVSMVGSLDVKCWQAVVMLPEGMSSKFIEFPPGCAGKLVVVPPSVMCRYRPKH